MNLYQKITDYKGMNEVLEGLRNELECYIEKKFINVPTNVKRVEIGYDEGEEVRTLNYPFLRVPKGFEKKEEKTYRKFQNCLMNEYLLESKELTIQISEFLKFSSLHPEAAESYFIEYTVNVNGEKFYYSRKINMMKRKCG